MASNNTEGFLSGLITGWSVKERKVLATILVFILVLVSLVVLTGLVFSIVYLHGNVQLGPFTITQPETPLERNCRLATEEARVWNQNISSEILALEAQVAAKDRELSETRLRCLDAQAKANYAPNVLVTPGPPQSRCRTEISISNDFVTRPAYPIGDYETALTAAAQDRETLESKIVGKEQLRAQQQKRLEQACFGADAQDATAKATHGPDGQSLEIVA